MTVLTVPSAQRVAEPFPRLRLAALVAVVANAAVGVLFEWLAPRIGAASVAEQSARHVTLLTPAGFTFAIWGLVYAASLAYAGYALTPEQRRRGLHERLAWPLLGANLASVAWVFAFGYGAFAVAELLLAATLGFSILGYVRARPHVRGNALPPWAGFAFSLWIGWMTVAFVVGTASTLVAFGVDLPPIEAERWAMALLAGAALLGVVLGTRFADPAVPAVLAWACAGIAFTRYDRDVGGAWLTVGWVAAMGAALGAVGAGAAALFPRFPARRPAP